MIIMMTLGGFPFSTNVFLCGCSPFLVYMYVRLCSKFRPSFVSLCVRACMQGSLQQSDHEHRQRGLHGTVRTDAAVRTTTVGSGLSALLS